LGESGFRLIYTLKVLNGLEFKGCEWSEFNDFFGKPWKKGGRDSTTNMIYKLNNYHHSVSAPGTYYLHIKVVNGIIVEFRIQEVDG
jgi:hypothetical protein